MSLPVEPLAFTCEIISPDVFADAAPDAVLDVALDVDAGIGTETGITELECIICFLNGPPRNLFLKYQRFNTGCSCAVLTLLPTLI